MAGWCHLVIIAWSVLNGRIQGISKFYERIADTDKYLDALRHLMDLHAQR